MINGVLYLPHEFEIIDEYPFKKKGTINFNYWERGDYVRTPDGVGIVVENEKEINTELDLEMSEEFNINLVTPTTHRMNQREYPDKI